MKIKADKPTIHLKLLTFDGTLYEGNVFSVSASNDLGWFDVLPGHANMMSIIYDCKVVIDAPDDKHEFPIVRGILKVSGDLVTIFT